MQMDSNRPLEEAEAEMAMVATKMVRLRQITVAMVGSLRLVVQLVRSLTIRRMKMEKPIRLVTKIATLQPPQTKQLAAK